MKISRELRHILGRKGEDTAVRYLKDQDCIILNRNWRTKAGELDIVALDGTTIVFAEVKTRRQNRFAPGTNLSFRQLKRNCAAGKLYLALFGIPDARSRYDLVEITVDRKKHRRIIKLTHSLDILGRP